jgi:hypothetical protein
VRQRSESRPKIGWMIDDVKADVAAAIPTCV